MKIQIPSSYEFVFEEKLDDLNSNGTVLLHKKTGARIVLIANDDDNKVFYIGFRTPPANSTGVAISLNIPYFVGQRTFRPRSFY